ncbi:unnamed protein product [Brassica oleracea var. botrytis]|uniref:Uncharacterized protein n=2 Tax=Brassica TaxID=3705 RepID=A0A3P6FJP8_BRAOL|nr:hypothetical protein HID58_044094 [Brassica napus]CAF2078868.1 unnamed protein product [Brassica napus]CDY70956.1 BnaUnng04120D [Brassica napus]VDD52550.1 unnamed protein product [Brassica oleracea]
MQLLLIVSRYFLRKLKKVKKTNGQDACRQREEPRTTVSVCVTRAEPGATTCTRSSVRFPCIQIIKTATVPASLCNRESTKQFHISKIKFPLVFRKVRPPNGKLKTTYKASKPTFSCKTSLCMILYSSLSTRDQVSVLVPQSL